MKRIFLLLLCAAIVAGSVFLQSCESETVTAFENEKIERVINSSEFQQFVLSSAEFQQRVSVVVSAKSPEEQEFLFQNLQNVDVVAWFLEKSCLAVEIANLQESVSRLLNNRDFSELQSDELLIVFRYHRFAADTNLSQSIRHTSPRLRNGVELPWQHCWDAFDAGLREALLRLAINRFNCGVIFGDDYDLWRWCMDLADAFFDATAAELEEAARECLRAAGV
jgi:hypothetical protein